MPANRSHSAFNLSVAEAEMLANGLSEECKIFEMLIQLRDQLKKLLVLKGKEGLYFGQLDVSRS